MIEEVSSELKKRGSKELCGVVMAIEIADPLGNVPRMYRELET